jgi:hypothetical protein
MEMQCRKCPYFIKEKEKFQRGKIILGFCKLRQLHISDMTMGKPQCKDRAVISLQ